MGADTKRKLRRDNEQAAARQFYVETVSHEERLGMLIIDMAVTKGQRGDRLFRSLVKLAGERQAHYWRRHRAWHDEGIRG